MAASTLTAMPSVITAGDTLLLNIAGGDYPATENWSLTYTFRTKDGSNVTFTSTANGSDHLFNVDAATTGTWTAGEYYGVGKVTDGTTVVTIWTGRLTVATDLSTQPDNFDTRTSAQICLDAINAVLEGKATRDVLSTTIAGQSITRMTFTELLQAKAFFESKVNQEQAALDAAQGKTTGNHVLIRFNKP